MRRHPQGLQGAGVSGRELEGRVGGPGQEEDQRPLNSDALDMDNPHVILKNGAEGDQRTGSARKAAHFHVEVELQRLAGSVVQPRARGRYGMQPARKRRCSTRPAEAEEFTMVDPLMRAFVAGQLKYAADNHLASWRPTSTPTSVSRSATRRAHQKAVWSRDNRTAGFRLCGEGGKAIRIECRIGQAKDLKSRIWRSGGAARGGHRRASRRSSDRLMRHSRAMPITASFAPGLPKTLREATECLDQVQDAARRARRRRWIDHYVHTAEMGTVRNTTGASPTGADARV